VSKIIVPAENQFERRLKAFLYDLRKAQLKRISDFHKEGHATLPGQLAVPLEEWKLELGKRTRPLYLKTFKAAAADAQGELARLKRAIRDVIDPSEVTVFVDELSAKIGQVVGTIRDQLMAVLEEAVAGNWTDEEAQAAVRSLFNDIATGGRMTSVARTETGFAVSGARDMAFTAAAIENSEWADAGDDRVRETHEIYGSSGPHPRGFNYAELVGESYMLRFPLDTDAPADEVIACRCVELPA
jgi:hypothetical protein